MKPNNCNLSFSDRLEIGKEFEDRASKFLTSLGFPIQVFFSAKGQWQFGESAAHVEIKKDTWFSKTGNVFIEKRERRYDSQPWRDAGIYDPSQPWFFLIGDESKIWLLPVSWLVTLDRENLFPTKQNISKTSEGMVVPVKLCDIIAIRYWENWTR